MNRHGIDASYKQLGDDALAGADGRQDSPGRTGAPAGSTVNPLSRFVVDVFLLFDGPVRVQAEEARDPTSSAGLIQANNAGPAAIGPGAQLLARRAGVVEPAHSLEPEVEMVDDGGDERGGPSRWVRRGDRRGGAGGGGRWRFAVTVAVAVLLVTLTTAATVHRGAREIKVDWQLIKLPPVEVNVEPPATGPIVRRITAPGKVEPVEEAEVGSQMSGRVAAVNVKEGDHVKAGQTLVKLDDADARSRVISSKARSDKLRAAITQAEVELAKANRDQSQHGKLAGRGFSSANELADARTAFAKAESALEISRHELLESVALWEMSQEELKRTEIRSPIDGVVTSVDVGVGEVVIAGTVNLPGSILLTVSDLDRMRVSAEVDESDVSMIQPGQPCRVFLQTKERSPITASVEKVASKGKKKGEAVSFVTHVRVDDPRQALRAGMTATVEIEVRRVDNALGVPVQAVVHRKRRDLPDSPEIRDWVERNVNGPGERSRDADARYVRVVFAVSNGVARARPVETGLSDERRVEVLGGILPKDRVIVGPFRALDELRDGQPVRVLGEEGDRR